MRLKIPSVRYAVRKWWRSVMKRLMMSLYIHPQNFISADISCINISVPSAVKSPKKGTSLAISSVPHIPTYDSGKLLFSGTSRAYHLQKVCKVRTSAPSGKRYAFKRHRSIHFKVTGMNSR